MDTITRFPVAAAAKSSGTVWGLVAGLVTLAATFGLVNTEQDTALQVGIGAVAVVVNAVAGLLSAFGVKKKAEPLVTPVADPRNDDGQKLLPAGGSAPTIGGIGSV
jgi:hypothetical protein